MPREKSDLLRALGQLLTAIQREETRALGTSDWAPTHAALRRAESLYWAAKRAPLAVTLGAQSLRAFVGDDWMARHPRVLPAVQQIESQLRDFAHEA